MINRRDALTHATATVTVLAAGQLAAGTAAALGPLSQAVSSAGTAEPFGYCLNTSTIRGQKLGLVEELEIASRAGYQAVEPWIGEIDRYVQEGGSLKDLAARIADLGLSVASAIGFAEWIVDDDARRAKGLEEARRTMDLVAQLGGTRIAAPPAGATDVSGMDLFQAAERYRVLLDLGQQMGVVPQLEVWGFSKTLSRLGETVLVALESRHPRALMLLDVYHVYRGGSDLLSVRLLSGQSMEVFHVNDYPAQPARHELTDAHRVYPGDGAAPLKPLFRGLRDSGFRGFLSLELFNPDYWRQDAFTVARTGLEKTRAAVQAALA